MRMIPPGFVKTAPPMPIPPLAPEVKLAAVNAMLDKKHKAHARQVSSTPDIVLTPEFPIYHQNTAGGHALWDPGEKFVGFTGPNAYLCLMFCPLDWQATYLFDLSVQSTGDWQYYIGIGGAPTNLTPPNGHLLYPFNGEATLPITFVPPANSNSAKWHRAELTKVG